MKVVPLIARLLGYSEYAEEVARAKRATAPKIPATTTQAPSMQRILNRDAAEDERWFNRPIPEGWKAKETPPRELTEQEVWLYRWMQHKRPDRNSVGQPDLPELSADKRDRGVAAFMSAIGSGLTYAELPKEDKARVKNYYFESLTSLLDDAHAQSVLSEMLTAKANGDEAKVDALVEAALTEKV